MNESLSNDGQIENGTRNVINIFAEKARDAWYGIAYVGEKIVASAVDSTRDGTVKTLLRGIPSQMEHCTVEKGSTFAHKSIQVLSELDGGNEEHKKFDLATNYMPEPDGKVLKVASAIPIGYVTSYGSIAKAANTEARVVGQIMARNPVYPIVACHRVVGTDFSLVGYGGRKSPKALQAKLHRLEREAKRFTAQKEVPVDGGSLTVFPVERVLRKAGKIGSNTHRQRKLLDY